jgi:hypothetical protein
MQHSAARGPSDTWIAHLALMAPNVELSGAKRQAAQWQE